MSLDRLCEEGPAHFSCYIFIFNDFAFSLQNTPQCTFLLLWTYNQDSFMDIQTFVRHIPHTALLVFHFAIQSLHWS